MSTTLCVPVILCKPKANNNCFAVMIFPFVTPETRPDAIECTTRSTESEGFLLRNFNVTYASRNEVRLGVKVCCFFGVLLLAEAN